VTSRQLPFLLVMLVSAVTGPGVTGGAELYPSIRMPEFPGDGGDSSTALVMLRPAVQVGFEDSSAVAISVGELLGDMPSSHYHTLMRAFRPDAVRRSAPVRPGTAWPRGRQIREQRRASGGRPHASPETLKWFRENITRATGRDDATEVRVEWTVEGRDRRSGAITDRRSAGSFRFALTR
jgi:hypothetical protein